ncbi:putative Cysteine protease ATG4B [Cardiosporidium cionae]|uniref:Cysteine protease n=1 Tax=Cardiosporidium cionae TaxID=476202 RepID=A0ABQ7J562_9APIC|nr:putative Cysteine protease ATG4B [Cardiosporidium cionae]|eukprot:KAF8819113.1 putative Cysteine protease ATG4B [Cardiosporidium cionae]
MVKCNGKFLETQMSDNQLCIKRQKDPLGGSSQRDRDFPDSHSSLLSLEDSLGVSLNLSQAFSFIAPSAPSKTLWQSVILFPRYIQTCLDSILFMLSPHFDSFFGSATIISLLGVDYALSDKRDYYAFRHDFESKILFSYRRDFAPIHLTQRSSSSHSSVHPKALSHPSISLSLRQEGSSFSKPFVFPCEERDAGASDGLAITAGPSTTSFPLQESHHDVYGVDAAPYIPLIKHHQIEASTSSVSSSSAHALSQYRKNPSSKVPKTSVNDPPSTEFTESRNSATIAPTRSSVLWNWFGFKYESSPITTDAGWGCMIRVTQMVLAQSFAYVILGRDWRRKNESMDLMEPSLSGLRSILWLFRDTKNAPFSVHNFVLEGISHGIYPGSWFGPTSAASTVCGLMTKHPEFCFSLTSLLFSDGTLYKSHVMDALATSFTSNGRAVSPCKGVLIWLCMRLGLQFFNSGKYAKSLHKCFSLTSFQGLASKWINSER